MGGIYDFLTLSNGNLVRPVITLHIWRRFYLCMLYMLYFFMVICRCICFVQGKGLLSVLVVFIHFNPIEQAPFEKGQHEMFVSSIMITCQPLLCIS